MIHHRLIPPVTAARWPGGASCDRTRLAPQPAADRRVAAAAIQAIARRDGEVFGALIRQTGDLRGSYTTDQLEGIDDLTNPTKPPAIPKRW